MPDSGRADVGAVMANPPKLLIVWRANIRARSGAEYTIFARRGLRPRHEAIRRYRDIRAPGGKGKALHNNRGRSQSCESIGSNFHRLATSRRRKPVSGSL